MRTLSLSTPHGSLDELEAAFASRVGGSAVFLPAPCDAPVGERVSVEVSLAGGEVALAFTGHVEWRYPPDAVPPGREAGVGVVVDEAEDEARALLSRLDARESEGAKAPVPGSRLGPRLGDGGWLRSPRSLSPSDEPAREEPQEATGVARFSAPTATELFEEHERRRQETRAEEPARPLPSPPAPDDRPLPRPPLVGAFFVYAYKRGRAGAVKILERFTWPTEGTQRLSESDVRYRPPGDTDDDDTAPWEAITDGQRAAPPWEVSDPGRRVTDIVSRALDEVADVDGALGEPPRLPPALPDDEDEAGDVREDVPSPRVEHKLPLGLRMRVDEGAVEPLFHAGARLPSARTVSLSPAEGQDSVRVAVFEDEREGAGRHLGTVRVRLENGEKSAELSFTVRGDGFLEVRSPDDATVAARWRTSWAEPTVYPRPTKRRGWRRWLPW